MELGVSKKFSLHSTPNDPVVFPVAIAPQEHGPNPARDEKFRQYGFHTEQYRTLPPFPHRESANQQPRVHSPQTIRPGA